MEGKADMDLKEDTIMEDMRLGMGLKASILTSGGADLMGLWGLCWEVWRAVVVWMLVSCFKEVEGLSGTWLDVGTQATRFPPERTVYAWCFNLLAGWTCHWRNELGHFALDGGVIWILDSCMKL